MGNNTSNDKPFKGFALIINHEHFDDQVHEGELITLEKRDGSSIDAEKLKTILPNFGFTIEMIVDKNRKYVMHMIDYYSTNRDMSEFDCLLVIVMSHGDKGGTIFAKDNSYLIDEIWEPFLQTEALKNKPKIFLFQACRGKGIEKLICLSDDAERTILKQVVPKLPHDPDFLIGFSTQEFHKSFRCPNQGTLYIQAVCQELSNIQDSLDIFSLMTNITRTTTVKGQLQTYQTPSYISFLRKPLFLYARSLKENIESHSSGNMSLSNEAINEESSHNLRTALTADDFKVQDEYKWHTNGHAIIFYTSEHTQETRNLTQILTSFKYTVKKYILTDKFEDEVCAECKLLPPKTGCLLVLVLAPLTDKKLGQNQHEPCFKIADKKFEASKIWEHFLPDNCDQLFGQPKLFFFVDPQNWMKSDGNGFIAAAEDPYTVTHSADFLFAYGFGKEYLDQLIENIKNGNDVVCSLTSAADSISGQSQLPHFQSSLRFAFNFQPPMNTQQPVLHEQVEQPVAVLETTDDDGSLPKSLNVQPPMNTLQPVLHEQVEPPVTVLETTDDDGPVSKRLKTDENSSSSSVNENSNVIKRENDDSNASMGSESSTQADEKINGLIVDMTNLEIKKYYRIKKLGWEPRKSDGKSCLRGVIEIEDNEKFVYFPAYLNKDQYTIEFCKLVSAMPCPYYLIVKSGGKYLNIDVVHARDKKDN